MLSLNQSLTKKDIINCPHGISSYFYSVNDKLGIKFFKTKGERDRSRFKQNIAYLSNLAPKVGEKVDIDGFYGYFTEKVKMIHDLYSLESIPGKILKQMEILEDDLLGCCDFEIDCNWKNYGIKNNQLVCVDFGDL